MENIKMGHWIFAGIFYMFFFLLLGFAYMKDRSLHRLHYKGIIYLILSVIFTVIIIYALNSLIGK